MYKKITFTFYSCGMSDKYFSDRIMIYKPDSRIKLKYSFGKHIGFDSTVDDFIQKVKSDIEKKDTIAAESIDFDSIYIYDDKALFRIEYNKRLSDVFYDFHTSKLKFVQFCASGASLEYYGYRFIVHSDEGIHRYKPHVHVQNDDHTVRYSLDTLTHFSKDKMYREFRRDEKKIILPYLKKNKERLLQYWDLAMKGYESPCEDPNGKQYYAES